MSKRKPMAKAPGLNLTSMVDILTVIVIFLIKQMDADGGVVQGGEGLKLPISVSQTVPNEMALAVQVNQQSVTVDQKKAMETSALRKKLYNVTQGTDSLIIPEVTKILQEKCKAERQLVDARIKQIQASGDENADKLIEQIEKNASKVMLQLDRNIDYGVMLMVMATAGSVLEDPTAAEQEACYSTISFVVEQKPGG
jgi:biopolymer transport protein ExbD